MDVAKKHSFASVLSNFELKGYLAPFKSDEASTPQADQPVDSYGRRGSVSSSSKDSFYTLDDEPLSDHDDHDADIPQAETPRPRSRVAQSNSIAYGATDILTDRAATETPRPSFHRTETSTSDSTIFTNAEEYHDAEDGEPSALQGRQTDAEDGITEEELRELEDELSPVPKLKSRKVNALSGEDPTTQFTANAPAKQSKPRARDFADIMLGDADDRAVDRLFGGVDMENQTYTKKETHISDVRRKIEWRATTSSSKQKAEDKRTFAKLILGGEDVVDPLAEKIFGAEEQRNESSIAPTDQHTPKPAPRSSNRTSSNVTDIADLITDNKSSDLADILFGSGELADQSYDPTAARHSSVRQSRSKSNSALMQDVKLGKFSDPMPSSEGKKGDEGNPAFKRMTMLPQRSRTRPGSPDRELKDSNQSTRLDFADIVLSMDDAQLDKLFGGGKLADQSFDRTLKRSATTTPHASTPGEIPPRTSSIPTQRVAASEANKQRVSRPVSPSYKDGDSEDRPKTAGSVSLQSAAHSNKTTAAKTASKRFTISGPISSAHVPAAPEFLKSLPTPVPPLPIPERRKSGVKPVNVYAALSSNPPNIRSMVRTPPAPSPSPPPAPTQQQQLSLQRRSQYSQLSPIILTEPGRSPPPPPPQQSPPSPPAQPQEEAPQRVSTDSSMSSVSSATDATSETSPESEADFSHLLYRDSVSSTASEDAGTQQGIYARGRTSQDGDQAALDDESMQHTPRAVSLATATSSGPTTPRHKPSISVDSAVTTDTTTTDTTMGSTTTADETPTYEEDDESGSEISAHDLSERHNDTFASPPDVPLSRPIVPQPSVVHLPPRISSLLGRTASFDSVAPPPISMARIDRQERAGSVGSSSSRSGSRLSGRLGSLRQSLLLRRQSTARRWETEALEAEKSKREEEELLSNSVSYETASRGRAPFLSKEVAEIYPVSSHGDTGDKSRGSSVGAGLLGFGKGKNKSSKSMKRGNVPIGLEVLREYAVNEALERQGLRLNGDGSSAGRHSADSRGSGDMWMDADDDDDVYRTPPLSARSAKRLSILLEE